MNILRRILFFLKSFVHRILFRTRHNAMEQQRSIFMNAIRTIVGEEEIFDLKVEPLFNGKAKMTLITESRRVMLAWVEVQDAWLEVQEQLQQDLQ